MAFGIIVRVPVSVAFGTDEEFDLRVQLQRELGAVLRATHSGELAGGEIDSTHINLPIENISEVATTLTAIKDVLARNGVLARTLIVLETRSTADPDDCDRQVLWPTAPTSVARSA